MLAGRTTARPLSTAIYGAAAVRRASMARPASAKRLQDPPHSAGAQPSHKCPNPAPPNGLRPHAGPSASRRKCLDPGASEPGDELSVPGRTLALVQTASRSAPPKCAWGAPAWGGGGGGRAFHAASDSGRSNPKCEHKSSRVSSRGQVGRGASEPYRRRGASAPARGMDPEPNPRSRAGSAANAAQMRAVGGHVGARLQGGRRAIPGPGAGGGRDSPSCKGNVIAGEGAAAGEDFARFLARQQAF